MVTPHRSRRCRLAPTGSSTSLRRLAICLLTPGISAFVVPPPAKPSPYCLSARRRNRGASGAGGGDFSSWYDDVDDDASPDDIFWEEMERQKLLSQIGGDGSSSSSSSPSGGSGGGVIPPGVGSIGTTVAQQQQQQQTFVSSSQPPNRAADGLTLEEERSADATLAQFKPFIVSDNWLDEHYEAPGDEEKEDGADEEDEIWDVYGDGNDGGGDDDGAGNRILLDAQKLMAIPELEKYRVPYEGLDEDMMQDAEEEYRERLSWITIKSRRLENARNSPKAKDYFAREPNEREGFDRMWVSAIDSPCLNNLVGVFRDYGVQFADNFDDWEDQSSEDGQWSIEDVASYKARKVYEVTGLPCIASRTSFEVEPARSRPELEAPGRVSNMNPKVATGYKFNNVGEHVDYLVAALKPQSDPTRVTRFTTCLCYYDGEMEIRDYGECDCDIYFSSSLRSFIPMSSAINEMMKTLQLTHGLEYQHWLKTKKREAMQGHGGVILKLRDRVLKDAVVLPNRIIDVSAFMDSKIDVNLMDECAEELANRFINMKPTKILTVATTGLVIAIPMAKYLQIPCVYARKERSVVMADTFSAAYSSKTVGKNRELLVSTKHIDEDDRVLIIDDFLSSGSSQDALLRIVSDAGATAVGVGVLMEKIYDSGRQSLSGYAIPVESLVGVKSVSEGIIRLQEEEGIDDM